MTNLILKKTRYGKGVFAKKDFHKGEFITTMEGEMYRGSENPPGFNDEPNHYLQIGDDIYIGPTEHISDKVNHSCNPNAAVKIAETVFLFALRDIEKGEEVT